MKRFLDNLACSIDEEITNQQMKRCYRMDDHWFYGKPNIKERLLMIAAVSIALITG